MLANGGDEAGEDSHLAPGAAAGAAAEAAEASGAAAAAAGGTYGALSSPSPVRLAGTLSSHCVVK